MNNAFEFIDLYLFTANKAVNFFISSERCLLFILPLRLYKRMPLMHPAAKPTPNTLKRENIIIIIKITYHSNQVAKAAVVTITVMILRRKAFIRSYWKRGMLMTLTGKNLW